MRVDLPASRPAEHADDNNKLASRATYRPRLLRLLCGSYNPRTMIFEADYSRDAEFRKLLAKRRDIDLTAAALELARDAYPDLDFAPVFAWIMARAGELTVPLARAGGDEQTLAALGACLAGTHGITGTAESYETADGSFLHRVIATKSGIPISLAVLYMAVANQAGVELRGVSAPGHFLTRFDGVVEPLFLDAFHAGKILTLDAALERVQQATDLPTELALKALAPVGPRPIIVRMLHNLKALYAKQDKWCAARVVQERLVALDPASYDDRRDLALITLKADRPGSAHDMLEACLKTCPDDERPVLEQHLAESKKQLAQWN